MTDDRGTKEPLIATLKVKKAFSDGELKEEEEEKKHSLGEKQWGGDFFSCLCFSFVWGPVFKVSAFSSLAVRTRPCQTDAWKLTRWGENVMN